MITRGHLYYKRPLDIRISLISLVTEHWFPGTGYAYPNATHACALRWLWSADTLESTYYSPCARYYAFTKIEHNFQWLLSMVIFIYCFYTDFLHRWSKSQGQNLKVHSLNQTIPSYHLVLINLCIRFTFIMHLSNQVVTLPSISWLNTILKTLNMLQGRTPTRNLACRFFQISRIRVQE